MSKAAKATEPTFEDALNRLESIVETMEGGELGLEELLSRYEEGARLVKRCQERLAAAEIRIRELDPRTDPTSSPDPDPDASGAPANDDPESLEDAEA